VSDPVFDIREAVVVRSSGHSRFELRVPKLEVQRGEKLALVGPSGSGKSTLLDLLAMVEPPNSVERFLFTPVAGAPVDVAALLAAKSHDKLAALRRHWLGYVLQTGGLLPFLRVRDNIGLSRALLGLPLEPEVTQAAQALGVAAQLGKVPAALSVGERQRVAVARALAHRPAVVLADEPTAALDPTNASTVMRLFVDQADGFGITVIVASHDPARVEALGFRSISPSLTQGDSVGTTHASFSS
jgi:putative ABC transport system ATP-binding protein